MLKQKKKPPCHCKAYKFPHRVGGGKCQCSTPVSQSERDTHEDESECTCFWKVSPTCPVHMHLRAPEFSSRWLTGWR
jgi:hypothetical protein